MEKEKNYKVVWKERFIQQFQNRVMDLMDQNEVLRSTITRKEALLNEQTEIENYRRNYEQLNSALYLLHKSTKAQNNLTNIK